MFIGSGCKSKSVAFTEFVPGMKRGSTVRNVIVGLVYLFFFYLIPFVLAYVIFTNRNGAADKLSGVPGISEGGGVVSAVAIFFISFLILAVISAALPDADTPGTDEAPSADGESPTPDDSDGDSSDSDAETEDGSEDTAEADSSDDGQQEQTADDGSDEQEEQVEETETDDTDGDGVGSAEEEIEDSESSDEDLIPLFEALVESEGVTVETAEVQGDTFNVEYTSYSQTEAEIANEIGFVAGAYAGMVGEGHTTDGMEATILTVAGDPAGTFYVDYEWAEAFANDEISSEEFSQRVLSTLEAQGQANVQGSAIKVSA